MKESILLRQVWAAASESGRFWRNNVGVLYDRRGVPIKYGLCPGSSDLIGIRPQTCPHCGQWTAGVFTAIEVKMPTARVTPGQQRFLDAVSALSGIATVARDVKDVQVMTKYAIQKRRQEALTGQVREHENIIFRD